MSIIRPWNIIWTVLFLSAVFVLAMPTGAYGAKGADDPGSYGAWGKDPRRGAGGVTLSPFNGKTREMTSFQCIVDGRRLSDSQVQVLSAIGQMGALVYRGKVDENRMGGRNDKQSEDLALWSMENYGHPKGPDGLAQFLKREKEWLNKTVRDIYDPNFDESSNVSQEVVNYFLNELNSGDGAWKTTSAWSRYSNREFQGRMDGAATYRGGPGPDEETNDDNSPPSKNPKKDRMAWSRENVGGNIWLYMDKNGSRAKLVSGGKEDFPLTKNEARVVAGLLNSNAKSLSTIYNTKPPNGLPDGCIPAVFENQDGMNSFGDLFDNPAGFVATVILAPVIDISNSIYQRITADAWGRLFHTAHTERGDLIWDLKTDCIAPEPLASRATSEERAAYKRTKAQINESCQSAKPLGFNKKNINANVKDRPLYLDLANLIAWLITGTYFVILFAAAVVFIYRGNKSQKFNLMKVAPRILLSIMVAMAAPFLIGALITVANWTTVGIFDMMKDSGSPLNSMNIMLSQAGDMMGLESEIARLFVTAFVSVVALVSSLIFFAGALIKQVALIFLIVLAPVAIFCLIVDSWRPKFMRWLKSLFVLVLLPVILATILMLAVLLNPIMAGSVDETLGVIMLIATLLAMGWVFKTGLSIAIRGKNTNFLGGIVTAAGAGLQMAAPALNAIPGVGSAAAIGAGVAGQGLRAGGQRLNRGDLGDKMAGALIPEGRSSGGAGGAGMLQNMGRSITHGVHIGQGRRGVFGRTGRYGRAGKKYDSHGGGGEEGEGKEKTPRNNPAARTYRKMKRSIGRAKAYPMNRLRERRTLRAKRRMEQGKGWDWVRPLTRPKSLPNQLAGAGVAIGASSMLSATQYRDENGNIHNYHATETLDAPTTEKMEEVAKDMERDGEKSFKDEEIQRRLDVIERNPNLSRSEKRKARKQVKFDVSFEMNREGSALNEKWKAEQAKILENINTETAKISPTGRGLSAGSASIARIHGGQSVVQTFDGAQYATNKEKTKRDVERRRREAAARAKQSIPPGFSGEKTTPSGIITPDSHTNH